MRFEYDLVTAKNKAVFVKQVTDKLNAGWLMTGVAQTCYTLSGKPTYHQTLIKENPVTEEPDSTIIEAVSAHGSVCDCGGDGFGGHSAEFLAKQGISHEQ